MLGDGIFCPVLLLQQRLGCASGAALRPPSPPVSPSPPWSPLHPPPFPLCPPGRPGPPRSGRGDPLLPAAMTPGGCWDFRSSQFAAFYILPVVSACLVSCWFCTAVPYALHFGNTCIYKLRCSTVVLTVCLTLIAMTHVTNDVLYFQGAH